MILNQCVILVGGQGVRLGELTKNTPKPLLHIAEKPFLDYLISNVMRYGIQRFLLLAGYRAEKIIDYYSKHQIINADITWVIEDQPAGTAGALKLANHLLDDKFFLLNGDSMFNIDLLDLAQRAIHNNTIAHLALRQIDDASRSGAVILAGERIIKFTERGDQGLSIINGGVYVLSRQIIKYINSVPSSLEASIFPQLAYDQQITGTIYDGFFLDIGIPAAYDLAQNLIPNLIYYYI